MGLAYEQAPDSGHWQLNREASHLNLPSKIWKINGKSIRAIKLGVSRERVKSTLHRWRNQIREIIKGLISETVESPNDIEGGVLL